jgi:hypothetical protein
VTAAECIDEIERLLQEQSTTENRAEFTKGRIRSDVVADLRLGVIREIEKAVEKHRVYGGGK